MGMNKCLFLSMTLYVLLRSTSSSYAPTTTDKLKAHLQNFSFKRHQSNAAEKEKARNYIWTFFYDLPKNQGEFIVNNSFTSPFLDADNKAIKGVNYVLVRPGLKWGKTDDKPVVLGTHYDTRENTPGVEDNGSGSAALLEVARVFSNLAKAEYTIIFASFDFEERNILPNGKDQALTGSKVFVETYLVPEVLEKYNIKECQGAIVLETIMNYNNTPNSQVIVESAKMAFPVQYKVMEDNEFRADFLPLIGRSDDEKLLNAVGNSWDKVGTNKYKYIKLQLPVPFSGKPASLAPEVQYAMKDFYRSDHKSFWDSNHTARGLPAIMMSDTAEFRGYMKECYHNPCDTFENAATPENLEFLKTSTEAVIGALVELAQVEDDSVSEAATYSQLGMLMMMTLILVQQQLIVV